MKAPAAASPWSYPAADYLESALKYLISHARWRNDADTIAGGDELDNVKNTHNLQYR